MFVLEPAIRAINLQRKVVLSIVQSINQPMVAAADYAAEETQAYVVSVQAENRVFETFIYLHLLETNQCVVYRFSDSPFSGEKLAEAETEALEFVESMGFMMDNLRFNRLGEVEQKKLTAELPIFYADLSAYEPILRERRQKRMDETTVEVKEDQPEEGLEEYQPLPPAEDLMAAEDAELDQVVDANEVLDLFDEVEGEKKPLAEPLETTQRFLNDENLESLFDPGVAASQQESIFSLESLDSPESLESMDPPENAVEETEASELEEMEAALAKSLEELSPEKPAALPNLAVQERPKELTQELTEDEWRTILGLLLNC